MWAYLMESRDGPVPAAPTSVGQCDPAAAYLFVGRRRDADALSIVEAAARLARVEEALGFLIDDLPAPTRGRREDGDVWSFVCRGALLRRTFEPSQPLDRVTPFRIAEAALARRPAPRIMAVQVGRAAAQPPEPEPEPAPVRAGELSVLIPHLGQAEQLARCLDVIAHERARGPAPCQVLVGLDHDRDRAAAAASAATATIAVTTAATTAAIAGTATSAATAADAPRPLDPLPDGCEAFQVLHEQVGPYAIRNHLAAAATGSVLVFHDSDDLSVSGRFGALVHALRGGRYDLVGSHELRLDLIERRLLAVRFPLDVTAALRSGPHHALLHPTSAITASAFARWGGFSDYGRHSLDTEFLLRAHVLGARIANLDRFLYLRIVRPGSLTTSPATGYKSTERRQMWHRWYRDFDALAARRLTLDNSSLALRRGRPIQIQRLSSQARIGLEMQGPV